MPAASRPSGSDRPSLSLAQAVAYLKAQSELTVASALDNLKTLDRSLGITTVYQECFPREYRRHLAKLKTIQPMDICEHLIESFTDLVGRKYFPVNNWDLQWLVEQFPSIPISLENFDVESEFENVEVPIQIAAAITGHYSYAPNWATIQDLLGPSIVIPTCFVTPDHRCHFDFALFTQRCRQHPAPIATFPQMVQILGHDTGSMFLDVSYDWDYQQYDYTWTRKDILELQRQWRLATRLLRTMQRTVAQLQTRPQAWSVIFACWEATCQHTRTSS